MVLVQNWPFLEFVFLFDIGLENDFYNIIGRKSAFLGYKNLKFKKSKNCHFSKRVNPWFWSKYGHFYNIFFLGTIPEENDFYGILDWRNAFLGNKNKKFQKSKNWPFSKGVRPWFGSKYGHFCNICF